MRLYYQELVSLIPTNAGSFVLHDRDLLKELLADKRSQSTKRAYEACLKDFFKSVSPQPLSPQLIREFLELERFTAIQLVLQYKAQLIEKGLSEATINQRLAAIKSLVSYAQKVGKCLWSLEEIKGEKVKAYRDTAGVEPTDYQKLLELCERQSRAEGVRATPKGARDYALLRLIWDNALRRSELSKLNLEDFDPEGKRLWILGKGKGTQREAVSLSEKTILAIQHWLSLRDPKPTAKQPLFVSVDRCSGGSRLSGDGIYKIVRGYAEKAGFQKVFSPHRGRHSSITAAARQTGGDVRKVQKLSRHARLDTVMIYVDNLEDLQGQVTNELSDLV